MIVDLLASPAVAGFSVAGIIQVVLRDVWDHRRGAPKPEPTVGEDRVPVDDTTPDDRARFRADNPDQDDDAAVRPSGAVRARDRQVTTLTPVNENGVPSDAEQTPRLRRR